MSDRCAARLLTLLSLLSAVSLCGCANGAAEGVSEERVAREYRSFQDLMDKGRTKEAIAQGKIVLALADRMSKGREATKAVVLYELGVLHGLAGEYFESRSCLEDALVIVRKHNFGEILEKWQVMLALAKARTLTGDFEAAESLHEETLQILESLDEVSDPTLVACLANFAQVYLHKGDFKRAESLLDRAVAVVEANPQCQPADTAMVYLRLAELLRIRAEYGEALELCARSLDILKSPKEEDEKLLAEAFAMKCRVLRATGQYDEAERALEACLDLQEQHLGSLHPDMAFTLAEFGGLAESKGDYLAAEDYYNRSLQIRRKAFGARSPALLPVLNNIAGMYWKRGDYEKAAAFAMEALELHSELFGGDYSQTPVLPANLAVILGAAGQLEKAEGLLLRALEVLRKTRGPDHPYEATILGNLAALYDEMGRTDDAERLYRMSLDVGGNQFGIADPEAVDHINNLAILYLCKGNTEAAQQMFERALKNAQRTFGDDHPKVAQVLTYFAALEESRNRLDAAAEAADRGRRIMRTYLPLVMFGLTLREQIQFQEIYDYPSWGSTLSMALAHRDDATMARCSVSWILNGKSIRAALSAQRAKLLADEKVLNINAKLADVERTLAALVMNGPEAGDAQAYVSRLAAVEDTRQKLLRRIGREIGERAVGESDAWATLESVQDCLMEGTVLIEVVRVKSVPLRRQKGRGELASKYVAWLITDDSSEPPEIVDLGEASLIESAIQDVRTHLQTAHADIEAEGEPKAEGRLREKIERLSSLVIAPLARHLAGKSTWLVSPDGALWLVPWEMLILDGKYVIEDHAITYLISGRELLRRPDHRQPLVPVVVADPDFDALADVPRGSENVETDIPGPLNRATDIDWSKLRRVKWSRLPGTREEARRVIPALARYARRQEVVTLLGKDATEREFKRRVKRPRVLVASTHGFFIPVAPRTVEGPPDGTQDGDRGIGGISVERPGPGAEIDGGVYKILANNPLLQCGLVLAGANRDDSSGQPDREDGILTGLEAASLDLTGTELVILSACDTAMGEVHVGEGVASLRQAFLAAGAEDVIATLWKVPDTETADLVGRLVEGVSKGQPVGQALRQAQLNMISRRRQNHGAAHPLFWASFTRTGNWKYPGRFDYREVHEGAWLFEERWPDGSPKVQCEMKPTDHGSLLEHGKYACWHRNGQETVEGHFVNGNQEGIRVEWHSNGVKASEDNYEDGVLSGPFVEWNAKGEQTLQGQYLDGEWSGRVVVWDEETGDRLESVYRNGKRDGLSVGYTKKGAKFCETQYKNDLEDGKQTFWNENGEKTLELEYSEGVLVEQ